jgi:hypothetical protein
VEPELADPHRRGLTTAGRPADRIFVRAPERDVVARLRWQRAAAAAVAAVLGYGTRSLPPDLADFAEAGRQLFDGRLAAVYAAPWNQAGPVQLLVSRVLMIGGRDGMPAPVVLALIDAALVLACMVLRLSTDQGVPRAWREAALAVLALLWLAVPMPWNGHPAELAVPLCWAGAAALQRRGKWLPAAALLGLAVAIAPWALAGFGCLLAAPGRRRALRTAALGAGLGAACYAPFVLAGPFAMLHHRWPVAGGTLVHLLAPDLQWVTWWVRLIQAGVVAGGCALAARRFRDDRLVIAVAPLTAALLRVATDPLTFPYYWFPVGVAALLALAMTPWQRRLPVILVCYLAVLAESLRATVPGALLCLALLPLLIRPPRRLAAPSAKKPGDPATALSIR